MSLIEQEPLFKTRPDRPSVIPIDPEFQKVWSMYKQAEASFWTVEELKLTEDRKDWKNLEKLKGPVQAKIIKEVIENIFAFFSGADGLINENLAENFSRLFNIPEIKCFYGFQIAIENIHNEAYGILIQLLIQEAKRQKQLLNAIHDMPNISKLYAWVRRWIQRTPEDELRDNPKLNHENPTQRDRELAFIWCNAKRLAAMACVEGIMFSGPFLIIFWLKEQGLFPGLTFTNELISRDEGMHTVFSCYLYSLIVNKPDKEEILQIVREVVEFKQEFMESFMGRLPGLNKTNVSYYLEFVADTILKFLGYDKFYNTPLPEEFNFMKKISFDGMTNFFEKRVGEYSLGGFESDDDDGDAKDNLLVDDF